MALDVVAVARVIEQRGIDAGEQPVIDHDLLAAPPLLGRRPEEHDLARQLVRDGGQGDRRADTGRGHRVVAAAVAETGQGVVLGEDPDAWAVAAVTATAAAACRPDGRREAARRVLHLEPVLAEDLGDPGRPLGAPRTPAPGWRGSGGTGRRSRRGPLGRPRRRGFSGPPGARRDESRSGRAQVLRRVGRAANGAPPADGSVAPPSYQRSAESVASATAASARMKSAIGSSSAPCSRRTMKIATISPIQPPRRAARVQSPW